MACSSSSIWEREGRDCLRLNCKLIVCRWVLLIRFVFHGDFGVSRMIFASPDWISPTDVSMSWIMVIAISSLSCSLSQPVSIWVLSFRLCHLPPPVGNWYCWFQYSCSWLTGQSWSRSCCQTAFLCFHLDWLSREHFLVFYSSHFCTFSQWYYLWDLKLQMSANSTTKANFAWSRSGHLYFSKLHNSVYQTFCPNNGVFCDLGFSDFIGASGRTWELSSLYDLFPIGWCSCGKRRLLPTAHSHLIRCSDSWLSSFAIWYWTLYSLSAHFWLVLIRNYRFKCICYFDESAPYYFVVMFWFKQNSYFYFVL